MNIVSFRNRLLATSMMVGATLAGVPALAQDAATAEAAAEDPGAEIVVTGSRIARPELSLPNPVQVLSAETIEQSGRINVVDVLVDNPALLGSQTNIQVAGSNLANAEQIGINQLNLRNLGVDRTLVLVDGRRHIAGSPGTAAVDVNTIPVDLIERVEVLTGGASAVYGADGVSGVVNFILKSDFDGLRLRAQNSISQRGDAATRFIAVTAGKNFSDGRGNITLSYEFNQTDRFSQLKRLNYGQTGPSFSFQRNPADLADDPNVPDRLLFGGLRFSDSSPGGAVDLDGDFVPDFTGEGRPYDRGTVLPGTAYTIGGDSTPREGYFGDFTPYTRRHIFNAMARYQLSPAFELFAQAKYVRTSSATVSQPSFDFYTSLFADNPYLQQRFGANVVGDATITRDNFDLGVRRYELDRELFRSVIGVKGDIAPNLKYEISYVFGQSTSRSVSRDSRISDRYYAALDAVRDPVTGAITCRINLPGQTAIQYSTANSTPYLGISDVSGFPYQGPVRTFTPGQCQPLNILGDGTPQQNQAALAWVLQDNVSRARIRQHVVSASVSGDTSAFFRLPGGPLGFAAGAEYRKESSVFTPSGLALIGAFDDSAPRRVDAGRFDVKEAFAEVNLPILADLPFVRELSVGGAVRLSDYSTIGRTTTWNVNGSYSPVRDITFRGTYAQAVRAPNIAELFAGGSGSYEFIVDPCDPKQLAEGTQYRAANCTAALRAAGLTPAQIAGFDPANSAASPQNASLLGFQGGNPRLNAETAKTWTAGVVLRPSFVRSLTMTADWYDIRLKQAINFSSAQDVVDLCYDQPTLNNIYCASIQRSGNTGFVSNFSIVPENVAAYKTAGLDATLSYRIEPFANSGLFNLRLAGNYLDKLEFVPAVGAPVEDQLDEPGYARSVGTPLAPKYSATFDLGWSKGPLTLNYGINWFSRTRRVTREQQAANPDYVPAGFIWFRERWEHELYANVNVEDRFDLYGGINNLFDRKPDVGAAGYPVSAVGRAFFLGVKAKVF